MPLILLDMSCCTMRVVSGRIQGWMFWDRFSINWLSTSWLQQWVAISGTGDFQGLGFVGWQLGCRTWKGLSISGTSIECVSILRRETITLSTSLHFFYQKKSKILKFYCYHLSPSTQQAYAPAVIFASKLWRTWTLSKASKSMRTGLWYCQTAKIPTQVLSGSYILNSQLHAPSPILDSSNLY